MGKSWLDKGKAITVQSIPGHSGLKVNEIANREATRFAQYPHNPLSKATHTLSYAQKIGSEQKNGTICLHTKQHDYTKNLV